MPSNSSHRLEALFESYLLGTLSETDAGALAHVLTHDAQARRDFRRFLRMDANLNARSTQTGEHETFHLWENGALVSALLPGAAPSSETGHWEQNATHARLIRNPFWAAAAGLILGLVAASAVWAYSGPSGFWAMESALTLVSEDFESTQTRLESGFPKAFHVWSGDTAAVVGPQPATLPLSGHHMLRLIRTDYPGEMSPKSRSANQMLVLDMTQYRDWIATGQTRLGAQAAFRVNGLTPRDSFSAGLDLFCFAEDPRERGTQSWAGLREEHVGMAANRRPMKPDATQWESVQVGVDIPPETRFVLLHLVVSNNRPTHTEGGAEFAGAYVDDVSVQLRRPRKTALRAAP